jgi:hypothetical protein
MGNKNIPPVCLKINNIDYTLNGVNEGRVKKRLQAKYKPETPVEEWVDGVYSNTLMLQDIFVVV